MKTLTFEEFEEKYKPQENLIIKENTYLYEIFGEELEYVKKQHNNFIWTLIDTDDEEQWIIPGYHIINRSSYLITEIPWENENIQVNYNEMIDFTLAKITCLNFFFKKNKGKYVNKVSDYFSLNKDETFESKITLGKAKYLAIDCYEHLTNKTITEKQEDLIHDYYNNLV
jgi:hypothetical protein